ncbi:recombinase family protein [Nitratifractor sp.]
MLLRQLSGEESLLQQRASIVGYAERNRLTLDREMIEFERAGRPLKERRSFQDFLHSLEEGDRIVAERIEVLGQTMEEVIVVINCMLSHGITLHLVHPELSVEKETGLAQILPLIVRLDETHKTRERDSRVGRPKGRRSASKFDVYLPQIMAGLKADESVSAIARELGVSRSSLKDYIESRHLKEILDDSWLERAKKNHAIEKAARPEMACTLEESTTVPQNLKKGRKNARSDA